MKRILIALVLLCSFSLLFAQGGTDNKKISPKELHLFHFKVDQIEEWELISKEYAKVEPGIKLVIETVGGASDWNTALKTKFAAGNGPDIFIVDGPALAKTFMEYLTDLSDQSWAPHVVASAKAPLTFDGKLMGMPFNLEGYGFIYNKQIFRDAGISKVPSTVAELRQAAEKIQAIGITPFGNGYSEWWVIGMHLMNIPFAFQSDPQAFSIALDAGSATIYENDIFKNFKELFDLTIEYGNKNSLTTDHNAQMSLFNTGKVAMVQQGNWKEGEIYSANPNADIGLLPIPVNNDADFSGRIPVGVPFYWVVNNQSALQDDAKKFLEWMVTSEFGRSYITEKFAYIPAFDNIDSVSLGGLSRDILDYATQGKTIPWSFTTWHDGMYNEFAEHTQKYVAGRISYDEMLVAMQASWEKLAK
ncbi:MAG: ABC transporter substrate-binding protein [Spirochaetae bacterium HGW-Spirochaetae-2]|jgi:raffinose/stachyose/melibiose transport system substrate-binding protein|nr:MAG: ABC transporter substrate-binding protein [Spirochaetae bacterium HGW-Spirochaetae-2]